MRRDMRPIRSSKPFRVLCAAVALLVLASSPPLHAFEDPQDDDVLSGADKFAAHAKDSSEVTLDKNMLGLAGNFAGLDTKRLAGKLQSVLIRDYTYAAPGQYRLEDVEQIRKRLDGAGWTHLVRSRETTDKGTELSDICVRTGSDGETREMVIIDAEPTELSFIHLRGHLSAEDLSQLSGSLGGPTPPAPPKQPRPPQ